MEEIKKAKVPEVVLLFWIIKILATTLGETGGDSLSMSLGLGYLTSTFVFAAIFVATVFLQIRADKFHPLLYWTTIIATTTVGTTLADYCDRSLGVGYAGGSSILFALLLFTLLVWRKTLGSVSIHTITTWKAEAFYWLTIMFSQTLGTAFGDWLADSADFGYVKAGLVFGTMLAILTLMYFYTKISRTFLFWSAFILTRPLGAVVGDFLDKPISQGGLELSRYGASVVLIACIGILLVFFRQKAAEKEH